MALTFPLDLAGLFDRLARIEATFDLGEAMLANVTGGGEVITSTHGTRLWRGRITGRGQAFIDLDAMTARVDLVRQAGASFLVTPSHRDGPQADPLATILGAATPEVTTVHANSRDVTISGLPAAYVLTEGDLVSFTYLASPTRFALHKIVTGATANGSGVATVELMPPLRPGHSVPFTLRLDRPRCKAVIVPGSYQPPVHDRRGRALFSFDWQQTLR
jgi:hypothetical protein